MARPHTIRKANITVPPESMTALAILDQFSALPPIPQPKPWTDDFERAAVFHCLQASPPFMALCAAGAPNATASVWLSDEPPQTYERACVALRERLKQAEQACAASMFRLIAKAAQDPRYWTAAAWTLERKHGYIVQQSQSTGPTTVVNIGQLVIQANSQSLPNRADIIEVEAMTDSRLVSPSSADGK